MLLMLDILIGSVTLLHTRVRGIICLSGIEVWNIILKDQIATREGGVNRSR
jgi:hypothetical protein